MSPKPVSKIPDSGYIVYTDGGSRGNPGPAASAFVIFDASRKHLHTGGDYLGLTTNNVAEYQAVILALKYISHQLQDPISQILFNLDSKLVVEQLSGRYKIKQPHLQKLAQQVFDQLTANHLNVIFTHIPRSQNALADQEVNRILDSQPMLN